MLRIASPLLFLILLAVPSWAEVYRCRTADGQQVFTDDPANFPSGCRQVEAGEEPGGGISFVPLAPVPTVAPPPSEGEEGGDGKGRGAYSSLREEAASLAREYGEVVASRITSLPPAEVQKARERTVEIIQRRGELLRRLAAAGLSSQESAEIRQLLGAIPGD